MLRGGGPLQHFLEKFFHAHVALGRRYDCEQTFLALLGQGFHVMFEQCLERLLRLPFRVRGAIAFTRSNAKASWK
jgi:hypothetical protein